MGFLWIYIVACLVFVVGAEELTFELPDNAKQCFYEEVDKGVKVSLEYQVCFVVIIISLLCIDWYRDVPEVSCAEVCFYCRKFIFSWPFPAICQGGPVHVCCLWNYQGCQLMLSRPALQGGPVKLDSMWQHRLTRLLHVQHTYYRIIFKHNPFNIISRGVQRWTSTDFRLK